MSLALNRVRGMRFELTRRNRHYPLKVACLPISPPAYLCLLSEKRRSVSLRGVPGTGIEPARLLNTRT